MNDLEQKAYDNEIKVGQLELTLSQHILQYNLRLKQEKKKGNSHHAANDKKVKRFQTVEGLYLNVTSSGPEAENKHITPLNGVIVEDSS